MLWFVTHVMLGNYLCEGIHQEHFKEPVRCVSQIFEIRHRTFYGILPPRQPALSSKYICIIRESELNMSFLSLFVPDSCYGEVDKRYGK